MTVKQPERAFVFRIVRTAAVAFAGAGMLTACSNHSQPNEESANQILETPAFLAATGQANMPVTAAVPGPRHGAQPLAEVNDKKQLPYTIKIESPASVASGANATTKVIVTPNKGWHLNKDFPTQLVVAAPDGVTLAKAKLGNKDAALFTVDKAVFDVAYSVTAAGAKAFTANFKFAVCTDTTCDPKRETLAWNLRVE